MTGRIIIIRTIRGVCVQAGALCVGIMHMLCEIFMTEESTGQGFLNLSANILLYEYLSACFGAVAVS